MSSEKSSCLDVETLGRISIKKKHFDWSLVVEVLIQRGCFDVSLPVAAKGRFQRKDHDHLLAFFFFNSSKPKKNMNRMETFLLKASPR